MKFFCADMLIVDSISISSFTEQFERFHRSDVESFLVEFSESFISILKWLGFIAMSSKLTLVFKTFKFFVSPHAFKWMLRGDWLTMVSNLQICHIMSRLLQKLLRVSRGTSFITANRKYAGRQLPFLSPIRTPQSIA